MYEGKAWHGACGWGHVGPTNVSRRGTAAPAGVAGGSHPARGAAQQPLRGGAARCVLRQAGAHSRGLPAHPNRHCRRRSSRCWVRLDAGGFWCKRARAVALCRAVAAPCWWGPLMRPDNAPCCSALFNARGRSGVRLSVPQWTRRPDAASIREASGRSDLVGMWGPAGRPARLGSDGAVAGGTDGGLQEDQSGVSRHGGAGGARVRRGGARAQRRASPGWVSACAACRVTVLLHSPVRARRRGKGPWAAGALGRGGRGPVSGAEEAAASTDARL